MQSPQLLKPYQMLFESVKEVANLARGIKATVNYDDFTNKFPGKYMFVRAMRLHEEEIITGVFASDWQRKDFEAYLFASSFEWSRQVTSRHLQFVPRLRPIIGAEEHFAKLFGKSRTLVELSKTGYLCPTLSGRYRDTVLPHFRAIGKVEEYARQTPSGTYEYDPRIVPALGNALYLTLEQLAMQWQQTRAQQKSQQQ